jgi:hypothetical protein
MEHEHATETFLLSASLDGTAAMWSLDGSPVGVFGGGTPATASNASHGLWSIHDRSTWLTGGKPVADPLQAGGTSMPHAHTHIKKRDTARRGRRGTMQVLEDLSREGGILSVKHGGRMRRQQGRRGSTAILFAPAAVTQGLVSVGKKVDQNESQANSTEEAEPKVGRVWTRYDDDSETYMSVLTIVRVDERSNVVIGWDGMSDPRNSEPKVSCSREGQLRS